MDVLKAFFRLAAIFGLASSVTSCWSPLFDQNVSLAALTASKLSLDARFDASFNTGSNNSNTVLFAVPSRERAPTYVAVFSLQAMSYGMSIFSNTGGGWASTGNGQGGTSYSSALSDPELVSVQVGMPGTLFSLAVYLPTLGTGQVQFMSSATSYSIVVPTNPALGIWGMTSYPTSTTQSDLNVLSSSTLNQNDNGQLSATTIAAYNPNTGSNTMSYNGAETYGWYAYDEANNVGYLTHYTKDGSGNYTTEGLINGSGVVAAWSRKDRVVAFLTTGQLLTREGSFYDVCDAHGTIQFSFPAGSLKFAGEYLDSNGSARCSFTDVLPLDGSSNSSSATQRVQVYSIATSSLSSLK